jgi:hypothetical protein
MFVTRCSALAILLCSACASSVTPRTHSPLDERPAALTTARGYGPVGQRELANCHEAARGPELQLAFSTRANGTRNVGELARETSEHAIVDMRDHLQAPECVALGAASLERE